MSVPPAAKPRLDRRYVTAAMLLVMVLASMEATVTSTAMPTIIGDLHGLVHYSWVASVYLLTSTVSMPLYGRLADALGRKRVILAAIGIFAVGSVLAGMAQTMTQLILCRGLQGLGAGGIMPVVLTILGDIFTLEERAQVQGVFSAVWGTASLAGPALGAFLVHTLGWRAIFYVNLPFGVLGLGVLWWKYHEHEKPHSTDLDLPGVISLSLACTALLLLVSGIGVVGGGWGWTPVLLALTVGASVWFVRHERNAANPIMAPATIFHRQIGPYMIASFLMGAGFLSLDTYVPLYVQGARGGGVTAAAGVVTPVMLTWALSSFLSAPLVVRWGFRTLAMIGSLLITLGFLGLVACAFWSAPHWLLTTMLAVTGLGFGPTSMSCLLGAQHVVSWQQRGITTSSVTFFRTIGGAIGVGALGAGFNLLIRPEMQRLENHGIVAAELLDPKMQTRLTPATIQTVRHMMAHGLFWVFVAMLACAAVQCIVAARIKRTTEKVHINRAEAIEAAVG